MREISRFQAVSLCVIPHKSAQVRAVIDQWGTTQHPISVLEMDYNDCWFRDSAPTFVIHRDRYEVRGVDWNFNGWGNQFAHEKDVHIARRVLEYAGKRRYKCPLVMEGGSFHSDGLGTLITTAECLLNPNRNPQCSKADIEALLCEYLAVQKIIWIEWGVYGDSDTAGHVDNLCCFVRPGEVALTFPSDPSHPQYDRSQAALEVLKKERDARGLPLTVHLVEHPPLLYRNKEEIESLQGEKREELLAASYLNFYIGNQFVLMPGFGVDSDVVAFNQLSAIFPSHNVIQIPAREILFGGGNIHCITQQQPRTRIPLPF